jgi:hypothetical protein
MAVLTFNIPIMHNVQFIKRELLTQELTAKYLDKTATIFSINEYENETYYIDNFFEHDMQVVELQRIMYWFITLEPIKFLNFIFNDIYEKNNLILHIVTNNKENIITYHKIIKLISCDQGCKIYEIITYQNIETI